MVCLTYLNRKINALVKYQGPFNAELGHVVDKCLSHIWLTDAHCRLHQRTKNSCRMLLAKLCSIFNRFTLVAHLQLLVDGEGLRCLPFVCVIHHSMDFAHKARFEFRGLKTRDRTAGSKSLICWLLDILPLPSGVSVSELRLLGAGCICFLRKAATLLYWKSSEGNRKRDCDQEQCELGAH